MNIEVKLLHSTPLSVLVGAIRQCYESFDKSDSTRTQTGNYLDNGVYEWKYNLGSKDKALIERIINHGHTSTLEHINFNFHIKGISRLNLQELARHRMANLSVKSSRYTLKELKDEETFTPDAKNFDWNSTKTIERIEKYINLTDNDQIDNASIDALENLRLLIQSGISNDEAKYALPECYKVDLYWTINARSLQNFLTLRMSKQAHFEIRELANKVYNAIPEDNKFLFKV